MKLHERLLLLLGFKVEPAAPLWQQYEDAIARALAAEHECVAARQAQETAEQERNVLLIENKRLEDRLNDTETAVRELQQSVNIELNKAQEVIESLQRDLTACFPGR